MYTLFRVRHRNGTIHALTHQSWDENFKQKIMIPSHIRNSYAGPSQERPGGPDMPANNEKSKFK